MTIIDCPIIFASSDILLGVVDTHQILLCKLHIGFSCDKDGHTNPSPIKQRRDNPFVNMDTSMGHTCHTPLMESVPTICEKKAVVHIVDTILIWIL